MPVMMGPAGCMNERLWYFRYRSPVHKESSISAISSLQIRWVISALNPSVARILRLK